MKKTLFVAGILWAAGACAQSYVPDYTNKEVKVKPTVPVKAYPFDLKDVRLLDGPFKEAMEADSKYLLEIQPDRLLCDFRAHAGLTPKGAKYGGRGTRALAGR